MLEGLGNMVVKEVKELIRDPKVLIGIIIVLFGISEFIRLAYPNQNYSQWISPLVPIILGILIIAGAIYGMQRRRY